MGKVVKSVNYGENNYLVQEVIDFIKHVELFRKSNLAITSITIIKDFERAKELAWSQDSEDVEIVW